MANQPPVRAILLAERLHRLATGVDDLVGTGTDWPGPSATEIRDASEALRSSESRVEAAYAVYKEDLAERERLRNETAAPLFRKAVRAGYLLFGKDSERLRELGFEPIRLGRGVSRLPGRPAGVRIKSLSASSVLVSWKSIQGADRYHIYYGTDPEKMVLFGSSSKGKKEVTGLLAGIEYFFQVTAINGAGESLPSPVGTARTL